MTLSLAEYLTGPRGSDPPRVWLESSGYARRLLLGPGGDPWAEGAAKYLQFLTQACGLLRPDVVTVNLGELFRSWLSRHPDLVSDMGAKKRATYPLRRMLEEQGPRDLLDEVCGAVANSLGGQAPLVLSMPSPHDWLRETAEITGRDFDTEDLDASEDAAMYMADFIRCVSTRPLSGLLLEEGGAPGPADRYTPVLNAARHYRWAVAGRNITAGQEALFDLAIGTGPDVQGLDVGTVLFAGGPVPPLSGGAFYYAKVPETHAPEQVLDALKRLRM
ncbi:hypothetical protein [Rhodospirillum sp. A1_3_36]|uniref:hypothetical protein n=1 Tax=Rhodospirillum sp. A1_3_36 TaxID=3391666 RepID=UPI0039A76B36